jgi:O-antigen/teichoic acid export membrane protein
VFDYASTILILLITTKILIEQIGTEGYGFYMFFTSLVATFGLVDLGMGMAVSKYLSEFLHHKKVNEANQVITIALYFYTSISIILMIPIYLFNTQIVNAIGFGAFYSALASKIILVIAVIFFINMLSSIFINILVAEEHWSKISFINIVIKIANALVLIYVLFLNVAVPEKIFYIFILIFIFSILKLFIYIIYAKISFRELKLIKPSIQIRQKILKFLKFSAMQYGLSLFVGHIDKFIITRLFGLEALGVYSFVVTAFVYIYGFLTNIFKVYMPKLSKLHGDQNLVMLKSRFKNILMQAFILAILFASFSLIIWKPFISIYLDQDFAEKSFSYMQIFSILLVVKSPEIIFYYFFNAVAKPSVLVTNLLISSVITVVGYFMFIPYFHIFGIIMAQILGHIIVFWYNYLLIRKKGFHEFSKS